MGSDDRADNQILELKSLPNLASMQNNQVVKHKSNNTMKKIDTHELTNVNKIRSTRILIVDDEPFNVLGMKVLL